MKGLTHMSTVSTAKKAVQEARDQIVDLSKCFKK